MALSVYLSEELLACATTLRFIVLNNYRFKVTIVNIRIIRCDAVAVKVTEVRGHTALDQGL